MSKSIIIDKESFTRTKKKLKKSLESRGVSFSLSEVSDVLAQSFGFKNEFDMQKKYFNHVEAIASLSSIKNNGKALNPFDMPLSSPSSSVQVIDVAPGSKGVIEIITEILSELDEEDDECINIKKDEVKKTNFIDVKEIISALNLKTLKGNIVVAGKTGSGVTTLVKSLLANKKDLVTINQYKNEIDAGYARKRGDLESVKDLNKDGKSVVFGIYGNYKQQVIGNIKQIEPEFDISSINYLLLTDFVNGQQHVIIYDINNSKEIHITKN